ncbi:MAG: two-component system sensor histidine kinase/response regulator [Myxococcota bacterium]|jgi:two-component system sensor histidine kinase/response regulator
MPPPLPPDPTHPHLNPALDAPAAYLGQALGGPLSTALAVSQRLAGTTSARSHAMLVALSGANLIAAGDFLDQVAVNPGKPLSGFAVAAVDTPLSDLLLDIVRSASVALNATGRGRLSVRFDGGIPASALVDPLRVRHALSSLIMFMATRTEGTSVRITLSVPHSTHHRTHQLQASVEADGPPLTVVERTVLAGKTVPKTSPESHRTLSTSMCLLDAVGAAFTTGTTPEAAPRVTMVYPLGTSPRIETRSQYGHGRLGGKRALVISTDRHARAGNCVRLTRWQMAPTAVAGLAEARQRLAVSSQAGHAFDVVLVDTAMAAPELEGLVQLLVGPRPASGPRPVANIVLLDSVATEPHVLSAGLESSVAARMWTPHAPDALLGAVLGVLAPQLRPPESESQAAGTVRRQQVRILVAEDNPINQLFTARMLHKRGHHVTVANNGADVLDAMATHREPFDAVLMDIQMPVLDGVRTTEMIRAREQEFGLKPVPIIAVTAHAMHGEGERFLDAGMDAYIPKPVVEDHLLAAIEAVIPHIQHGSLHPLEESPLHNGSVFDAQRILDFVDGDIDFLQTLVTLFVTTSPTQVTAIGNAIAAADPKALNEAAHQLKGSVANFAAEPAKEAASVLETMGRQGDLNGADAAHQRLSHEVDVLCSQLRAFAAANT